MELIDLVNSVISNNITHKLIFLVGSLAVTLTVLPFWIYSFLTLVFVLQWLSIHWKILIMLSPFPFTFQQTQNWIPFFIAWLMAILLLIRMVFAIIYKMFHGSNFVSGFRL